AVLFPGFGFLLSTARVLPAGAAFVMRLGGRLAARGLGHGVSPLLFRSFIEGFPRECGRTWEAVTSGVLSLPRLALLLVVLVGVVAGVVGMTMAARKIPFQIPRKVMGRGRIREGQKSFIPLRINSAGVMPIIFAQS